MQKKIIVSFVSILLISLVLIIALVYINSIKSNSISNNRDEQEVQDKKMNDYEKNNEEIKKIKEETEITKETKKNDTSLNNNISKQEDYINNNTSTKTEENITDNNMNLEDSHTSESISSNNPPTNSNSTTENNKQYIGIPNPNDFYYSFHKGQIDDAYNTLEECYNKAFEVGFLDTVDIINETCYEVLDGQGTVLGIYMSVNCNSGNCERYKKMVGINTN